MTEPLAYPKNYQTKNYNIPMDFFMERYKEFDIESSNCKLKAYLSNKEVINYPISSAIGIDPGKDWGITVFPFYKKVLSFHCNLNSDNMVTQAYEVLNYLLSHSWITGGVQLAVVENAAFGAPFGQVSLAEKRAAFIIACHNRGIATLKVPPQTIRKKVFGSATIAGKNIWININENAADSIPMALLGFALLDEQKKEQPNDGVQV